MKTVTDEEWEESGFLTGLSESDKPIVVNYLNMTESKYGSEESDNRAYNTAFSVVRIVLNKLLNHSQREKLLPMFDMNYLCKRNEEMHASGKVEEYAKTCVNYIDGEAEMTCQLSDDYVTELEVRLVEKS